MMERNKKPIGNLTLNLEKLISLLEKSDDGIELSQLKKCYSEAVRIAQSEVVSGAELAELSTRVRSSVVDTASEVSEQILKISLGYNLLSRVA